MPGTLVRPPSWTAWATGRPVMTASVPIGPASRRSAAIAPGWACAAPGSATIGDRVPSKSDAIRAPPGAASTAARAACPSGVADRGSPVRAGSSVMEYADFPTPGVASACADAASAAAAAA
jgi:hypothetical protein